MFWPVMLVSSLVGYYAYERFFKTSGIAVVSGKSYNMFVQGIGAGANLDVLRSDLIQQGWNPAGTSDWKVQPTADANKPIWQLTSVWNSPALLAGTKPSIRLTILSAAQV